jgi:hypothetical protein
LSIESLAIVFLYFKFLKITTESCSNLWDLTKFRIESARFNVIESRFLIEIESESVFCEKSVDKDKHKYAIIKNRVFLKIFINNKSINSFIKYHKNFFKHLLIFH